VRPLLVALVIASPLGAEFLVSDAPDNQIVPAVTTTSYGFLCAWQDSRDLVPDQADHIYASRLAPDGSAFDPAGLQVSSGTTSDLLPALACTGDDCIVIWHRGC
jgi:hypothetical protein